MVHGQNESAKVQVRKLLLCHTSVALCHLGMSFLLARMKVASAKDKRRIAILIEGTDTMEVVEWIRRVLQRDSLVRSDLLCLIKKNLVNECLVISVVGFRKLF